MARLKASPGSSILVIPFAVPRTSGNLQVVLK
jgi:hypothetical protein